MDNVSFAVIGEPFGKKRPRANIICGHAHMHNDPENERYELKVLNAFNQVYGKRIEPMFVKDTQLITTIEAYYPMPKAFSKKKREMARLRQIRPTKKPDCDNIAKSVLDALNGVVYYDDSQVVELVVKKFYDDNAYVYIEIGEAK